MVSAGRNVAVLHLSGAMLTAARAGEQNFVKRLTAALGSVGWSLEIAADSLLARIRAGQGGHSLWHMDEPPGPGGLVIRRTYMGAFWHIERVAARWDWPVAQAAFDPAGIDPDQARAFQRRWRDALFPGLAPSRSGHVFVPLQARLLDRRSFQAASPVGMLEAVLTRWPGRRVEATLHPGAEYTAEEREALTALAARHPALTVSVGGSLPRLAAADLVVTQNSSMAFQGFFLNKPALLFAGIDFHHPAASVPRDGIAAAFDTAEAPRHDLALYLWWFLKGHAINAGSPEAEVQILAALRRGGWPV